MLSFYIEITTPDSLECRDSKYCHQPAGHMDTIITDSRELCILSVKDLTKRFNCCIHHQMP